LLHFDLGRISVLQFTFYQLPGNWRFKFLLNEPFQRSRTIHGIVSALSEVAKRRRRDQQRDSPLRQAPPQAFQLDFDDLRERIGVQWMEHDRLINPIQKLGPEMAS